MPLRRPSPTSTQLRPRGIPARGYILCALAFAVAFPGCSCGGGSDNETDVLPQDPEPGEGGAGTGGLGGSGNACSLSLSQMTPAPETHVATPRTVIELEFSEPVDPTTVDGESVILRERESKRLVPVEIAVDGAHVTLTPQRLLGVRYRYNVEVAGVASALDAGCTVEDTARFFTAPNFETLYVRYLDGAENRADIFTYDEAARELAVDFYVPGPDGQLLTDDDVQDVRSMYFYDALGDVDHTFVWDGPGVDQLWATDDDRHWYGQRYTHVGAGIDTYYVEWHGADGLVGTSDDTTSLVDTYAYDEDDRYLGFCNDDGCIHVLDSSTEEKQVSPVDPGPDGNWMTDDDVLGPEWQRREKDSFGNVTTIETHALAADGTATVTPTSLTRYADLTIVDGLAVEVRAYSGAGDDGIWRTADDVGDTIATIAYDADGFRNGTFVYFAGPDELLATADDVIYQEFFY